MGNRHAREHSKQQDREASWDRLRSTPWQPFETRRAFDSGKPRVQIIRIPTFSKPVFWELCQRDSKWVLYPATIVERSWPNLTVQGYEPVEFASERLNSHFDRLVSMSLPITPFLNNMTGADGTVTQLALLGDLWSHVRYQWWSEHPPGWSPLVQIADEMLSAFGETTAAD